MSAHTKQVGSVLQRALQAMLVRGLNDPRIRGLISVTDVNVSDDLAEAVVSVSILPAEHAPLTMEGLRSAAKHLRHELGREVSLRRMPRLVFRLDESLKKQAAVHAAISRATKPSSEARPTLPSSPDEDDPRTEETKP